MPQKDRDNIVDLMTCSDEGRDELEEQLRKAAKQIVARLSGLDAVQRKELLGCFVSELFFASSEEEHRAERPYAFCFSGYQQQKNARPAPAVGRRCHV